MAKPTQAMIDKFGEPGTSIENSRFYRGYCSVCGSPIRVPNPDCPMSETCFDCDGHVRPCGPIGATDDDDPSWANARKVREDGYL